MRIAQPGGSSRPTARRSSLSDWNVPAEPRWMSSGSVTISSTLHAGIQGANGSWKMICKSRRRWRSSVFPTASKSRPWKLTVPDVGSIRRRIRRPECSCLSRTPDQAEGLSRVMSSETSSTARTSPPPFPPNGDAACANTFVMLRTSISGTLLMLAASSSGTRVAQRDTSSRGNQWHRRQSSQQSDKFPAAEVFFQNIPSQ